MERSRGGKGLYYCQKEGCMEAVGNLIGLALLGLALFGLQILCRQFLDLLEERASRDWPTMEATITWYTLRDTSDGEASSHDEWTVKLQYSYEVCTTFYSGSVRLAAWKTDETAARRSSSVLMNQKILIRYKPDWPAKSLYLKPVEPGNYPMVRHDRLLRRVLWLCFF
jgi:hypothetical protein